jgi:hypothetical protein
VAGVPRVRDLLYRFRPAAAPGSASAAGVPADRERDLAAELEPVFASLADTHRECADIVERSRLEAARISAEGAARAEAIRTAGRARVAAERAATAAAVCDVGSAEVSAASAEVDRLIDRLHERAEQLLPSYVDAVVESVRALVGAPTALDRESGSGGPP